jgi:hypothetical protein
MVEMRRVNGTFLEDNVLDFQTSGLIREGKRNWRDVERKGRTPQAE